MARKSSSAIFFQFVLLITLVVVLSLLSAWIWGGRPEKIPESPELVFQEGMTLEEFGQVNDLPNPVLKAAFGIQTKAELSKALDQFNLTHEQITEKVDKSMALAAEEESKDWIKILVKFALWIVFLVVVFFMMRKGRITPKVRQWVYLASIAIFGIVLGSDPSAMGTVKDAIVLYASKGVIFPPRMIALTVFLLMVLIANKFICSWGCQSGVLQDMIFRLNRSPKDTKGIIKQYKPGFLVTNTIRVVFFAIFTLVAFLWAIDIIEYVDPFKIYKLSALGAFGIGAVALLMITSLFIYRPWCHLFCPFGLVGWLFEKISIFKIKVDYETCIACEACSKACPSTVMNAILKRENVIPDCFACANCIDICPSDSISLASDRRMMPPEGKFESEKVT